MGRFPLIILLSLTATLGHAQAFDGDFDKKFGAGYMNFNGQSGAEVSLDYGISDYFSYGWTLRIAVPPKEDGEQRLLEALDAALSLSYHAQQTLRLPSQLDLYAGLQVGPRNAGLAAGVRYNFCEQFGLYGQAVRNVLEIMDIGKNSRSFYADSWGFSVGLTINLE